MKKKIHKSKTNKKIFGVCGGIAEYFEIDATIIRFVAAIFTLLTPYLGIGVIMYLICAFIFPTEDQNKMD